MRHQRSFEQALRFARSVLAEANTEAETAGEAGALLSEIDHLLLKRNELRPDATADACLELRSELTREVEELRREVERLRLMAAKENGLLSAILNESPHGILVSDLHGKLLVQNRAAERIWAGSATANDVEGWGQYRAFHPDGRAYAPSDWSMARCLSQNQTVQAEEVHFQRFDGTHGMLLGSCAPIRGPDGDLLGAVSVFADMTKFKELERLKDRWVAMAGHEIRSPLHVLKARIAMASQAHQDGYPVDLPALLRILGHQVERLESLVDDMLDVSRAQAGTLAVQPVPAALTPLVTEAAESVVKPSPQHFLQLETEEVMAMLDEARTEQIVTNLLANAVRYSPDGGRITVQVKRLESEALVQVSDEGQGFEPSQAMKLFEPFFQVARAEGRTGGLGLGLYLCRELVHAMRGRIWARSEGRGMGATFAFTLPLAGA